MSNKLKTSIKTKVIFKVSIIITLILTIAISFIIYISISNLEEKTNLSLKNKLKTLSSSIELRLEYLRENTEYLANNELLINTFINQEESKKYLIPIINNFKKDKYINSLSILDFEGRNIYQTDNNKAKFDNYQELWLSLSLSQTVTYFKTKEKEIAFIVPIKYYNTAQGAIVVTYNMTKIIEKYNKLEDSIYTKFFKNEFEYYTKNYKDNKSYYKVKQLDVIDYGILHNLNITVEIGILQSVYLQPLQKLIAILLLLALLILTIGVIMSYYLARTITNPILALYTRVNKVLNENKISKYMPLDTNDELEELGYAFYKKEKELFTLNKNLDLKVKEAIKNLEEEKNRFSLAIEGAQDGLWDWNIQTNTILLSERFETMLGYQVGELPQDVETWFALVHPDDKIQVKEAIEEYLNSKGINKTYEHSFRLRTKDASWRWIRGRGKALFNEEGLATRFVGFNTDITQQIEYQNKLNHISKHDSLTNLPNRFLLSELLTHAMHSVKRTNQHLALLFIDLDGFKKINDSYGHEAGDEVLTTIACRMNEIVRESDIVARLGGDEFVIVASELKNNMEIVPMLHRLLSDLSSIILYEKNEMNVSASIGVSFYPQINDIGNEVLLRQADQAMYQAKLLGKNQYQFYNIEASQEFKEIQGKILSLRKALTKNELVLYYQPKVNMTNNKVLSFEALLRWNHPQKGTIYPDSFLPLVQHESSFMIELGHWVLELAFAQLESWHLAGHDITISVNISSHEIKEESFSTYLKELLSKYPAIKPNTIELEILESSAFDNFELTSKTLIECQNLGVTIAIDDFGTGYASLHYLKKLPMNTLKIDTSFVIDLLTISQNISIIEASIGLAHAFNSKIVAEGVESEEHGKVLLQLGCEIAQGYCISKAMPAKDVISWIKSWKGFPSWEGTKPISEEKRPILHASIEINNWINSIEDYLKNKTSNIPQLNETQCHLGKWIQYGISEEERKKPEFEQLKKLHSKLHNYADKLLLVNKDEYSIGIKKLKELRKEILTKLEILIKI
jgi:diguanylate cyclase (GGDEF)-like protein/PAS domain S-box-containing protein